jgi:hypothetical protein
VDDGGGFLQGAAAAIPSYVATGPTGTGTWGWDTDGSYGDWYGGHELAHTFDARHPGFCNNQNPDSKRPPPFHPNGRISPSLTGDTTIYGFDIGTRTVYPPDYHDVMTYCDDLWISDFTYEGLMQYVQDWWTPQSRAQGGAERTDRLLVTGSIDPGTHEVELQPLFVIPNADDLQPRVPGDYAIVLRSASGAELAHYPFTPDAAMADPAPWTLDAADGDEVTLLISELVPYVDGTAGVDLEGPGGMLLTSMRVGASPPSVAVTAPNGGEFLDGNPIVVSWTASDPDGDPLTFNVQFSPDNG